jgi:outer membrane protein OmpA-like peptidoglycan-associated protein
MVHDVSRLKELLFDRESRTISDLSARMEAVFERSGTQERFVTSVAAVLDEALARAEVERHAQVSGAIAPLVVSTIRTEIRNSQDELAEALYPAMGRMVRDYVVSALRDLADDINRRFESNRFMLRVRSLLTGRTVSDLALADAPPLKVEEIYLVRRGSGELVGRWPASISTSRDHARSGVLAAINDVATEAFISDEATLRRLDLGSSLVYMRASPAHLLLVRCSGAAPAALEQVIDAHFMATIERLRPLVAASNTGNEAAHASAVNTLLTGLAADVDADFATRRARVARERRGLSPAALLLWTILLLLLSWGAWVAYASYQTARVRGIAERIIAAEPELRAYPVHVAINNRGGQVALQGLVPKPADSALLVRRLREALPGSQVSDGTAALPGGLEEARAQIEGLSGGLAQLGAQTGRSAEATRSAIAALMAELQLSREDVAKLKAQLAQSVNEARAKLETLQVDLARLTRPTAEQRLAEWVHTHAIFFVKDTSYRDDRVAAAALDELAALIKGTKAFVRVVGHTDEKGGETHNSPLSLARATKVVAELSRRGIPANRIVAVGRNDVANLTPTIGDASPNRRVEFEIGFMDEAAR